MHARIVVVVTALAICSCARPAAHAPASSAPRPAAVVIAVESVLADFTRQVAGGRVEVRSLIPYGRDPRAWEPAAQDIRAAVEARLIISNGAGLETFMDVLMSRAGEDTPVMEASHGLEQETAADGRPDPCLWLDPVLAVRYVQNIRDALSRVDPAGELTYGPNADAYIHQLRDLDAWISDQVAAVPPDKRTLATRQEGLEYFSERYGIQLVAPAGSADSAGSRPILDYLTDPSGPAPTYLEMMRYDVGAIVESLGRGG